MEKWLTIATVAYGLFWIPREGALWSVLLMGGLTTLVAGIAIYNRCIAGRTVAVVTFVAGSTAVGAAIAALWVLFTFFYMALKTGLHAHGPEFLLQEIAWLWGRSATWIVIGAVLGLGLGLVLAGRKKTDRSTRVP